MSTRDQEFIEAIRAVVAERGADYVYPEEWKMGLAIKTCRYVVTDAGGNAIPGCIIGAALARMGYTTEQLTRYEDRSANAVLGHLGGFLVFSFALRSAANSAQAAQDIGETWSSALAAFEECYLRAGL